MSDYKVSETSLVSVANAIRTKGGTSASLSFPDGFVSAVQNIPTGGGSTLITKSITSNGTYDASDDSADGYSEVSVSVPMPPFVTGTFTPQASEKNTAITLTIPYSGNGYPVTGKIYPTGGAYKTGTDIRDTAQKKLVVTFEFAKSNTSTTPDYVNNTSENQAYILSTYKNSDSDADSYTSSSPGKNVRFYGPYDSNGDGATYPVRLKGNTSISVFIADTNVYGFLAGQEYTYEIVYSE